MSEFRKQFLARLLLVAAQAAGPVAAATIVCKLPSHMSVKVTAALAMAGGSRWAPWGRDCWERVEGRRTGNWSGGSQG